jgi:hypothetical protein
MLKISTRGLCSLIITQRMYNAGMKTLSLLLTVGLFSSAAFAQTATPSPHLTTAQALVQVHAAWNQTTTKQKLHAINDYLLYFSKVYNGPSVDKNAPEIIESILTADDDAVRAATEGKEVDADLLSQASDDAGVGPEFEIPAVLILKTKCSNCQEVSSHSFPVTLVFYGEQSSLKWLSLEFQSSDDGLSITRFLKNDVNTRESYEASTQSLIFYDGNKTPFKFSYPLLKIKPIMNALVDLDRAIKENIPTNPLNCPKYHCAQVRP